MQPKSQASEVDEALTGVMTTMHTITPSKDDVCLGPTLTTEVDVEGSPVKALVDTGSPSTLMSLDFLLKVLAKQRKTGETPQEWRDRMQQRMEPPGPRLSSYGGEQLNTVCQIKVDISRGNHKTVSTVQVQKGAPIDLLLGTDLHSQLGIFVLISSCNDRATDLVSKKQWSRIDTDDTPCSQATVVGSHVGIVKLITATRVPARHARLVKARVHGIRHASLACMEPAEQLKSKGLIVEEAALEPDREFCVRIPIQNYSNEPIRLEPGELLGQLQPVTLVEDVGCMTEKLSDVVVAGIHENSCKEKKVVVV